MMPILHTKIKGPRESKKATDGLVPQERWTCLFPRLPLGETQLPALHGQGADAYTPTPQPARETDHADSSLPWPHQMAAWVASLSLTAELSPKICWTSHDGSHPAPCSWGSSARHSSPHPSSCSLECRSVGEAIKSP